MQVFTGEADDAGTDSEVSVTVYGENGDTGRRLLNKPRDGEKAFDSALKVPPFYSNLETFDTLAAANITVLFL